MILKNLEQNYLYQIKNFISKFSDLFKTTFIMNRTMQQILFLFLKQTYQSMMSKFFRPYFILDLDKVTVRGAQTTERW